MPYFEDISIAYKTLREGLKLTFSHLKDATKSRKPLGVEESNYFDQQNGLFTTQYPFESLPVPDNGRYRLDNEIDDCIVCDKCAKICPVNCIDIEPIKSADEIGRTSDGTSKRLYAAKFDIDMAKCCFCGLCTTVCPTECLTMTKAYDFSEFDVKLHTYAFGNMTEAEIREKKAEEEEINRKKEQAKLAKSTPSTASVKPKLAGKEDNSVTESSRPKPKFVPKVKPKPTAKSTDESTEKPKPKFRPKVKPKTSSTSSETDSVEEGSKPKFKPKIKPKVPPKEAAEPTKPVDEENTAKPKPKFRPKVKPKPSTISASEAAETPAKKDEATPKVESKGQNDSEEKPKPKFRPKPIIKKKKD